MRIIFTTIILFVFFTCIKIQAKEIVSVSFYEDKSNKISLKEAVLLEKSDKFTKQESKTINLGIRKDIFWISYKLKNRKSLNENIVGFINSPLIDFINVYQLNENSVIDIKKLGDNRKAYNKDYKIRYPVFDIKKNTTKLFMKVKTNGPMLIPEIQILAYYKFIEKYENLEIFYGIYFGVMLSLLLYNFMIFISIKDKNYLYYCVFIASSILFFISFSGKSTELFYPNNGEINIHLGIISGVFFLLSMLLFTKRFLKVRLRFPQLNKIIKFSVIFLILFLFTYNMYDKGIAIKIVSFLSTFWSLILILFALFAIKQKDPIAPYFLFSWSFIFIALITLSFLVNGIIEYNIITSNIHYVGSMFEAILLSLALAKRYKDSKDTNFHIHLNHNKNLEAEIDAQTFEIQKTVKDLRSINFKLIKQQRQVKKSSASAENANNSRTIFITAINHDLRQPLNSINILIECLNKNDENEKSVEIMEKIKLGIENLDTMFNSVLQFNESSHTSTQINTSVINVSEVIKQVIDENEMTFKSHNIHLTFLQNDKKIISDFFQFKRIISNLITNTIQHAKASRISISVNECCHIHSKINKIAISICDNGIGIPDDKQKLIHTGNLKNLNIQPLNNHAGLGLSIIKSICETFNYEIILSSKINKGTQITILATPFTSIQSPTLTIEEEENIENHHDHNSIIDISSFNSEQNVILIDDDETNLMALKLLLEKWNINSQAFSDTQNALNYLKNDTNIIDLIISDFRLRNHEKGTKLIQDIRKLKNAEIPAIIVTGDTQSDIIKNINNDNDKNTKVIYKPINPTELAHLISDSLKKS